MIRALYQMAAIAAEGDMGEEAFQWCEQIIQTIGLYYHQQEELK